MRLSKKNSRRKGWRQQMRISKTDSSTGGLRQLMENSDMTLTKEKSGWGKIKRPIKRSF